MYKILICGASGMVGRNLVGNAPSGYQLLTPDPDELNLLDYDKTLTYLNQHKPDMIINAAGIVGGIHANLANPVKFLLENTDIGRNIVWAAYNANINSLINLGSSCMYPRDARNPLTEDLILKGELEPTNEGYAIAKIFTQRLCSYINRESGSFSYKTVIPCNLYGKYDKFDIEKSHMIPAVIQKIYDAKINNKNIVEIWGDGTARREFMYAGDLADMIWQLVEKFNIMPELMNLGLGFDYTISDYYRAVAEVVGYHGNFTYNLSKPVGMQQKLVDISIQSNLGLTHSHSLREGIRETFEFYLEQIKNQ